MTQAVKKEGEKLYTVFSFAGRIRWRNGKQTVDYTTLYTALKEDCSGTVKGFFTNRWLLFEEYEMSLTAIQESISRGFVIVAISKTMKLSEVKAYVNAGFKILFMHVKEYNAMKKEYGN